MRHLLTLLDLSRAEIERIFAITTDLKAKLERGQRDCLLPGRVLALLFEKPSLRTRVSFETAIVHLGGASLYLGADVGWGKRESTADFSQVLGQYVDVVVCRTNSQQRLVELASHSPCSVINGLSDTDHPCQALADLFTIIERHGPPDGQKVAFIGDGNNVAKSLAEACALFDLPFALASPPAYRFDVEFVRNLRQRFPHFELLETTDPRAAAAEACCVYTDVWTSMGQEAETTARQAAFAPYQVTADLLSYAHEDACFLHCLPARRGEEVTDEVLDGPQSAVLQQAANRMHAQKGLLAWMLGSQAGKA